MPWVSRVVRWPASTSRPVHGRPPPDGAGFEHVRSRLTLAPPHVTGHSDHSVHCVHCPSTLSTSATTDTIMYVWHDAPVLWRQTAVRLPEMFRKNVSPKNTQFSRFQSDLVILFAKEQLYSASKVETFEMSDVWQWDVAGKRRRSND